MSNKFQVNGQSFFFKKKIDKNDNTDQQKKQFRIMQQLYQTNLAKFIKKNKQCFNGQIQIPVCKTFFTLQQLQSNRKLIDNIDIHVQRLSKPMIMKNNYLLKQHISYEQQYKQLNLPFSSQNPQQQTPNQQKQNEYSKYLQMINSEQNQYRNGKKQQRLCGQTRPFSAKIQFNKRQLKSQLDKKSFTRPLSSQITSKQIKKRNSIFLRSVDIHKVKIEKDARKVPISRKSLGQIYDQQKYQQQQVYIRKKIIPQSLLTQDTRFPKSPSFYGKKCDKYSSVRKGSNYQNQNQGNLYVNLIERQRLKNKIMMINTVLAFNLSQTQGYKAKSKCWANPLI